MPLKTVYVYVREPLQVERLLLREVKTLHYSEGLNFHPKAQSQSEERNTGSFGSRPHLSFKQVPKSLA